MENNSEHNITALEVLVQNPMYKLSMSSLELFHSNFLECLFHEDKEAFLRCFGYEDTDFPSEYIECLIILREFCLGTIEGEGKVKKFVTDIVVGFDFIGQGNSNDIVPLFIIENKLKSYPYPVQIRCQDKLLESLCDKQRNNVNASMLNLILSKQRRFLLSIFKVEDEVLKGTKFEYVNYQNLVSEIRTNYSVQLSSSPFSKYIDDYCDMIELLYKVLSPYSHIPAAISDRRYLFHEDFRDLKEVAFLDAFRKYQSGMLKYDIAKEIGVTETADGRLKYRDLDVIMDNGLSHKHAITSIFLKLGPELYGGVQVEHNQFRIMFNHDAIKKVTRSGNIPECISEAWTTLLENDAQGKSNKNKNLQCCSYGDECIYKWVKIDAQPTKKVYFSDIIKDGINNKDLSIKKVLDYLYNIRGQFRF